MKTLSEIKVSLTPAQAKATYQNTGIVRNGKPVFSIPTTKIISLMSGFGHKKLSDGPTFTCGFACGFSCTFCYVENQLGRNPSVLRITKETGLKFNEIAIEREGVMPALRRELLNRKGEPKYSDSKDQRVIFASPLVDVAANVPTAKVTIEVTKFILDNTNWQVRLLSKSVLLRSVAEGLSQPEYKKRVVYGVSTGTLDDRLAMSFELGTASPSARLRTLHWLQDEEFRTYGMLCPSLPQQNYDAFAECAAAAIRVDRCEHVWAEGFNLRGKSLQQTCESLRRDGFNTEADHLALVSSDHAAWENYTRKTFLALAKIIPPHKLRFLQYVQKGKRSWWRRQIAKGAVLLGKHSGIARD